MVAAPSAVYPGGKISTGTSCAMGTAAAVGCFEDLLRRRLRFGCSPPLSASKVKQVRLRVNEIVYIDKVETYEFESKRKLKYRTGRATNRPKMKSHAGRNETYRKRAAILLLPLLLLPVPFRFRFRFRPLPQVLSNPQPTTHSR